MTDIFGLGGLSARRTPITCSAAMVLNLLWSLAAHGVVLIHCIAVPTATATLHSAADAGPLVVFRDRIRIQTLAWRAVGLSTAIRVGPKVATG